MYEQAIQNMALQVAQLSADNAVLKARLQDALKQNEELQVEPSAGDKHEH